MPTFITSDDQTPRELDLDAFYDAWRLLSPNELIVNLRSPEDFGSAPVPGSKRIPFASVSNHFETLKQFDRVYFYCYGGKGSKATAGRQCEMGLANLCYLRQAGMDNWKSTGYPLG